MVQPTKTASVFQNPQAADIVRKAQQKVNDLGGVDKTFETYADPKSGGVTSSGIDRFLADAKVGGMTRALASGKVFEALDQKPDGVVTRDELKQAWELIKAVKLDP